MSDHLDRLVLAIPRRDACVDICTRLLGLQLD